MYTNWNENKNLKRVMCAKNDMTGTESEKLLE